MSGGNLLTYLLFILLFTAHLSSADQEGLLFKKGNTQETNLNLYPAMSEGPTSTKATKILFYIHLLSSDNMPLFFQFSFE